ncbi:MAG: hypothetical protein IJL29_12080, partial [Prevotella sp.]|nr:hypothetical protein [Prevotella sp.]
SINVTGYYNRVKDMITLVTIPNYEAPAEYIIQYDPVRTRQYAGYLKCLYLLVFKRDHVARSGQNKSDSAKLCCGTRFAQTVLALPKGTVFQSSHLLPSLSLLQPFKVEDYKAPSFRAPSPHPGLRAGICTE